MILVDTSVWVDHFRQYDEVLAGLLLDENVLIHPFIIGELALGNFSNRMEVISLLQFLPHIAVASDDEVLRAITHHKFSGSGIGYIDAHLLTSCLLEGETRMMTRDKKLASVATSILALS